MRGASRSERRAWQSVVMLAGLNSIGMVLSVFVAMEVGPVWPSLVSMAVSLLSLVVLWLVRDRPTLRLVSGIYLLNSATVVLVFHLSNAALAASGLSFIPFQGDKVGVIVAALLAPTLATGFTSIIAHVGLSVLLFLQFPPEVMERMAHGEPWTMLAFGVVASFILVSRFARLRLERQFAIAESERNAMRRYTDRLLAIKDQMNTPLQTLVLTSELLKEQKQADPALLTKIDGAVEALAKVNAELGVGSPARDD